jgi:hypothetical protein
MNESNRISLASRTATTTSFCTIIVERVFLMCEATGEEKQRKKKVQPSVIGSSIRWGLMMMVGVESSSTAFR